MIGVHDVDHVAHWLSSPKRAEFFRAHGMTVKTFVSPGGKRRAGVLIENVPSVEALTKALQGADAAEAMKFDGVHPDSVELFVASWPARRPDTIRPAAPSCIQGIVHRRPL